MTGEVVQEWIFGTGDACDVRVDDPYVSTRHCKVSLYEDGTATVEDLGSTNGTWVRPEGQALRPFSLPGRRVEGPQAIRPGVIIRIGHTDIPWKKP